MLPSFRWLTPHAGACGPCARNRWGSSIVKMNPLAKSSPTLFLRRTSNFSRGFLLYRWRDTLSLHVSKCVTRIISALLSLLSPIASSAMCRSSHVFGCRLEDLLLVNGFFCKPAVTACWAVVWGEDSEGSLLTHLFVCFFAPTSMASFT